MFGDYNPSGRLSITYPKSTHRLSIYDYKWCEVELSNTIDVEFEFGHDLSYTTFDYSNLNVPSTLKWNDQLSISLDVRNSGSRQGDHSVLLFISDVYRSVTPPNKELKAFTKVSFTTVRTINECTLNYLWNNKQQVILLYEQNADQCTAYMDRIGHFFQICQSPWPNTPRVEDLFIFLDEKVSKSRPTNCVNVVQGQITPDSSTIQNNPFSSLCTVAKETNRRLIEWLSHRKRDPSVINGVNVVICDFADQAFADAVIMLNYKTLTHNNSF